MTKPRLTVDEHRELGSVLTGIRNELLYRSTDLANAYPRTGPESEARRHLQQAMDSVEKARSAMENRLYDEHPAEATTEAYYAGDEAAQIAIPRTRRAR